VSHLLLVDRSDRMRMTFAGEKAKEALNGLVSNDVLKLVPGATMRAAALTAKGRVIALVRIVDRGADLLVDADAAAGPGFAAMIRKYVNPRIAKYAEVTATTGCLGVYGAGADAAVGGATQAEGITVIPSSDLAPGGVDIVGPPAALAALAAGLRQRGARDATPEEIATMRVEAGIPAWGTEMNDETIPQEAVLDDLGAIAFDKGCYTGQEVVARIHFRGHVNRHLRWLLSAEPVPVGATVTDAEGKEVGDVRSSVVSPTRGPLAIAMVRREVEPGSTVRVRHDGVEQAARVERIAVAVRS
jgi:folate-binding protein YgfZ